jgi:hypothetical protein
MSADQLIRLPRGTHAGPSGSTATAPAEKGRSKMAVLRAVVGHRPGGRQSSLHHLPHLCPSTEITFQSRVVATAPARSIWALVSFPWWAGCASQKKTSRP